MTNAEQGLQYELEQGLIAAAVTDPEAFFADPRSMNLQDVITNDLHGAVYQAAIETRKAGKPSDFPFLCEKVMSILPGNDHDNVLKYLTKVREAAPRTENIPGYISSLIDRATVRKVQPIISEGIREGISSGDLLKLIDQVRPQLQTAVNTSGEGLPKIECLADFVTEPPDPPPELIYGVLRRGHKMMIAGPSKAGKSFLLVQLAIALAEGRSWLGFQCARSKVLYLNFEIEGASMKRRFSSAYDALEKGRYHPDSIYLWNLRAHSVGLEDLVPQLVDEVKMMNLQPDAIILDPIYKVLRGDENSAGDMAIVCRQLDTICEELGCSVIYSHHHSKGYQANRKSLDRASGSGVFARDPDALLDLIQLEVPDHLREIAPASDATAWRLEGTLREFKGFPPRNFWFSYPLHILDDLLEEAPPAGSRDGNLVKAGKQSTSAYRILKLNEAFTVLSADPPVTLRKLSDYLNRDIKTVRNWCKEFPEQYSVIDGKVKKA